MRLESSKGSREMRPETELARLPHRIFTADILTTALPAAIPPGVGDPITCRFNLEIGPRLFQQLNVEWKTAVSAWAGPPEYDPWRYASDLNPFDNPDDSGMP